MTYTIDAATPALPSEGFIGVAQVLSIYPVSADTLDRLIAAGKFPKPIKISARVRGFSVRAVRDHLALLEAGGAR